MPSTGLLTSHDLEKIEPVAFETDQPYELILAAEMTERDGEIQRALLLAERAIEAHRVHGEPDVRPRVFRAQLLLRLGREDEAMAELTALRPLLNEDPDAVVYICAALEAGGRAETAEQWLTAALSTALHRREELALRRGEQDYIQAAATAFLLAQSRHRIRGDLDLPHDDYDDLADRLMAALGNMIGSDEPGVAQATVLFWPQPEFHQLLAGWPELADEYGHTWDEYRAMIQTTLTLWSESRHPRLGLVAGSVDELVMHAERYGGDPADHQIRQHYADDLDDPAREIAWPPGRNDPCWCGSPQKYKKCCRPRARHT